MKPPIMALALITAQIPDSLPLETDMQAELSDMNKYMGLLKLVPIREELQVRQLLVFQQSQVQY